MKRRLIGAVVLVVAAVVFVPMLLDRSGEDPRPEQRRIAPPAPAEAPARVVPLDSEAQAPAPAPAAPAVAPAPPKKASAKKSTKSATGTSTSAPAKGSTKAATFAVQLGSFSKPENARGLRDKLVASGYTAFVRTSGSVTRVYVGPQSSRAEAEKVLEKLLAETKLKGIVVNFSG